MGLGFHLLGMMRTVLWVEAGELEVIVDAAVNEMAKRWDRVCDFEDPNSGPQFVAFVHGESCPRSATVLTQITVRNYTPSVLT